MKIQTTAILFTRGKFFSIILTRYLINRVLVYLLMLATLIMAANYKQERYIAQIAIVGILGFIGFELFKYWNYVTATQVGESYGTYQLNLKDNGLTMQHGDVEQKIKWDEIVKSSSFVGAFVITTTDAQLILITKSSFPDIQAWNQFKSFIKGKF